MSFRFGVDELRNIDEKYFENNQQVICVPSTIQFTAFLNFKIFKHILIAK